MTPFIVAALFATAVLIAAAIVGPVGPTGRVALVVLLLAPLAIVVPMFVTLLAFGAVIGFTLVDAAIAAGRSKTSREVRRILPRGVPVSLDVHATAPMTTTATVRQAQTPDLVIEPTVDNRSLNATITGRRRGRHELPGVATRVTGPFGLATWRHSGTPAVDLLVFPDVVAAERIAARVRRNRFSDPSRIRRGPLGLGTEFETLRDYQPDDDIRQVNWRATARVGRPMSNQFRIEQDRDVIAVVDCGRLMAAPVGDLTRLDLALDAVAALVRTADVVGDRSGLVAFDEVVHREVRPQRDSGERVIRSSFDLEPTAIESDYELAFKIVSRRKRAFVCVFTDLIEEAAAQALIAAVPWLVRKHNVVIASVIDPDLTAAVSTPPISAEAAYVTAAAAEVLEARSLVAATLQRHGAHVIEASVADLPTAVVGSYLEAKKRARI